jgi:hypothetical protein
MEYIVATGNAFDGLRLHGPFTDSGDAEFWAQDECGNQEWTIVPVYSVYLLSNGKVIK